MPGFGFGYGQGAGTARRRRARLDAAPAYTAGFTLAQFPAQDERRIYQRSSTTGGGQDKGQGLIRVPIGSAGAGTIGVRIRAEDGITILQPEWTAGTIMSGATYIDIAGIDARLGWFFVDLKGADGNWQLGTVRVGMGAIFGFGGQSLMSRFLGRHNSDGATYASLGVAASDHSAVLAWYNDGAVYNPAVSSMPWLKPGDRTDGTGPNSVGIGELLGRMVALLGVNCGGVGNATGGTAIAAWLGSGAEWGKLAPILARSGNAFEGFFWGQGHNNAQGGLPAKAYGTALTKLFAQLTALNAFTGYGKYVWTIPTISTSTSWGTPYTVNNIRKGAEDWCAANGAVHVHAYDMASIDLVHENQAGAITLARHMYRAARSHYGASGNLGPKPLGATRSGTMITLALSDVGQTMIAASGTPGNRIFIFPRGRVNRMTAVSDNRFPVTSVAIVDRLTLAITLADDPGDGHPLDLWLYWPSGPADGAVDNLYDDRTDGDGLTTGRILQGNFSPIAIAAPVPGGAVNPPPSGFVAPVSPFNLTTSAASYAASDGGLAFGQQMTAGTAMAQNNRTPLFAPLTVELFFSCPTITSALQVLFGAFATSSGYIAINSAGKLSADGAGSAAGVTTLVPGRRYHAAYQSGAGGRALYLTDLTAGTPGVRDAFNATPVAVIEHAAQFSLRANAASFPMTGGGAIDQVAIFYGERYTGTAYTCPAAPFTGVETDIVALYPCDGDGREMVAA